MNTSGENASTQPPDGAGKLKPRARDAASRYKSWQLFATYVSLAVSAASLIVAIVGIKYVVRSLDNNTKSVRNSVQQNIVGLVTSLDRVFVDKPQLHPYFYECKEIKADAEDARYQEVFAAAIQTLDVLDIAAAQSTRFKDEWETPEAWDNWISDQFKHSPILRQVLRKYEKWYGKGMGARLDKAEEEMKRENKPPCG